MADVAGKTVMQAPDGRLYRVAPSEVEAVARDQGWKVADDASVSKRVAEQEQYAKHGSTGQQALGMAETAVRSATLGSVPRLSGTAEEARGRANVLGEESPILAGAAQMAPGMAAAIATGGAGLGLVAGAAAQGAIGGLTNLGAAQEEVFKRDERLSTEAAWGSFGKGALLGAAAEVGGTLIARGVGAARNRFVEAASSSARKAEAQAFEASGIVRPSKGLGKAARDPVAAAEIRQRANVARPEAQAELQTALAEADAAHQAVAAAPTTAPAAAPARAAGDTALTDTPGSGFVPLSKTGRRSVKRYESDMRRIGNMTPEERVQFDNLVEEHAAASRIAPHGKNREAQLYELRKDVLEEYGDQFPKREAPPEGGGSGPQQGTAYRRKNAPEAPGDDVRPGNDSGIDVDELQGGPLPAPEVSGDIVRQRHLVRDVVIGLRDDLRKVSGAPEGVAEQVMGQLDQAATQGQIYDMLLRVRGTLKAAADQTDNPSFARILQKYSQAADKLAESKTAWGVPAEVTAELNVKRAAAAQAKATLDEALAGGDYFATVGTAGGSAVDDALAAYSERLGDLLKGHGAPEAEQGIQALAKLRELTGGKLRDVAAGNQVDALSSTAVPAGGATSPGADLLGELVETAVENVIPGAGLVRKAWKYRRHIAQLVSGARASTERTAAALLAGASQRAAAAGRVASGAKAVGGAARGAARGAAQGHYFESLDKDPEKAYARVKETVQTLAEDPGRLAEALARDMGDLPAEAPELHEQIVVLADRAVNFLSGKIPPAFGFSMLYPDGPPPSRTDILELSLYWQGATDKDGTERRIATGDVMPEEMEAYRAVFQEAYASLQETTCIMAQEKARKGHALGAFQVAYLENTLELDGQLDPTFSDTVAQVYQDTDQRNIQAQQDRSGQTPPPQAGDRIIQKASYS